MLNSRGKTTAIFVVLITILLVCSTSIGFFLYHKEKQSRKDVEDLLEISHKNENKLTDDLKESRRQLTISLDKQKEVEEKINNLMDEIELNDGLRKELKSENTSLKDSLDAARKDLEKERDKIRGDMEKYKSSVDETERKYKQLSELYKAEQDKSGNLQTRLNQLTEANTKAEAAIAQMKGDLKPYNLRTPEQQIATEVLPPGGAPKGKVELDKIVVNPNGDGTRGRVLSVDKEAEFIVCSLGLKQGIKIGDLISVYRGDEYLGDVKVSRVQDELSAADIIPPFSSRKVRKNDIAVFKP